MIADLAQALLDQHRTASWPKDCDLIDPIFKGCANLTVEDITTWDHPLFNGVWEKLKDPNLYKKYLKLEVGALAGLKALHKAGHKIVIASNRPEDARGPTAWWLTDNLDGDGITEIGPFYKNKNLHGGDLLIDDKPENVVAYANEVGPAILMRRPWNQDFRVPDYPTKYRIVGVRSWEELPKWVENLLIQPQWPEVVPDWPTKRVIYWEPPKADPRVFPGLDITPAIAPKTFEDSIDEVLSDARSLMLRKQHDYGHGNILAFGELGVLVRVNDKLARLRNLRGKPTTAVSNESIDDTWMDLLNYALIALMLRRGTFTRELAEDIKQSDPVSLGGVS